MFRDQISKIMEVYINDMLVKSKGIDDHIKHLMQMFALLRNYQMKLNPLKCSQKANMDSIARLASTKDAQLLDVILVEYLLKSSIEEK